VGGEAGVSSVCCYGVTGKAVLIKSACTEVSKWIFPEDPNVSLKLPQETSSRVCAQGYKRTVLCFHQRSNVY
jgi:hypothetical protein